MQKALYALCYDEMIKVCNRYTNEPETSASIYNDAMYKVFKNIAGYKDEGKMMGWVKEPCKKCRWALLLKANSNNPMGGI